MLADQRGGFEARTRLEHNGLECGLVKSNRISVVKMVDGGLDDAFDGQVLLCGDAGVRWEDKSCDLVER